MFHLFISLHDHTLPFIGIDGALAAHQPGKHATVRDGDRDECHRHCIDHALAQYISCCNLHHLAVADTALALGNIRCMLEKQLKT